MNDHNSDSPVSNNGRLPVPPSGGVPPVSASSAASRAADEQMPQGNEHPELETLLREWHQQNAARATAGRERLTASLAAMSRDAVDPKGKTVSESKSPSRPAPALGARSESAAEPARKLPSLLDGLDDKRPHTTKQHPASARPARRRLFMNSYTPLAAAVLVLSTVMAYLVRDNLGRNEQHADQGTPMIALADQQDNLARIQKACQDRYVMSPDGGRLDALDKFGNTLGPCVLKHTDVEVNISGFLNRVSVKQVYVNPHSDKVETVYTFPLSERAAVDRMVMTIGSRVIEGQVKERAEAKRIYEQAKAQGRVASLLEQERPNIFTQSIANIEPQAEVTIEISYVEVLEQRDGVYSFNFPTTIAPRYIPGGMRTWESAANRPRPLPVNEHPIPTDFGVRRGIVLIGPAQIMDLQPGNTASGTLTSADLMRELPRATPVRAFTTPGMAVWYNFTVRYEDGSKETGTLYNTGAGVINGRGFFSAELSRLANMMKPTQPYSDGANPVVESGDGRPRMAELPPPPPATTGSNFSSPTTQVPDANRITPMPVRPDFRAGQDISITVNIDTGGPGIFSVKSQLHDVTVSGADGAGAFALPPGNDAVAHPNFAGSPRKTIKLRNSGEIPNRDFSLSWKIAGGIEAPIVLSHTAAQGNFFFVSVLPPSREQTDDAIAVPREIMFVLDRSGSMKGYKIEMAKALIDATLATLRPQDRFNVLCFSDTSEKLWSAPRAATQQNLAEARAFYGRSEGQGATEMLRVVSQALDPAGSLRHAAWQPGPAPIGPEQLVNLPADGRDVVVDVPASRFEKIDDLGNNRAPTHLIRMDNGVSDIKVRTRNSLFAIKASSLRLAGGWVTENGDRILIVRQVDAGEALASISPADLLNLPADDREVTVDLEPASITAPAPDDGQMHAPPPTRCWTVRDRSGVVIEMLAAEKVRVANRNDEICRVTGRWGTLNGRRLFAVDSVQVTMRGADAAPAKPLRLVAFITDGEVGNDMEVLAAIRRHRGDARVFSFAIGSSPNRYLLDGMSRLGRGEVDYVPLNSDALEVIARFTKRVNTPVLTDIKAEFSQNIQPVDVLTALGGGGGAGERVGDFDFIPDLYDQKPVIIVGRYNAPGAGTLTISGNTATGPWSKTVNIDLPAQQPKNSAIATLWARTKVESIMDSNLITAQRGTIGADQRSQVVSLGESFNLVTQFTSFVAVDRLRVTIDGKPRLVQIPIDFPQGDEWSGYFGGPIRRRLNDDMSRSDMNGDGDTGDVQKLMILGGHLALEDDLSALGDSSVAFDMVPQIDLQSLLQQSQGGGGGGARSPFDDDTLDPGFQTRAPRNLRELSVKGTSAGVEGARRDLDGYAISNVVPSSPGTPQEGGIMNHPLDWPKKSSDQSRSPSVQKDRAVVQLRESEARAGKSDSVADVAGAPVARSEAAGKSNDESNQKSEPTGPTRSNRTGDRAGRENNSANLPVDGKPVMSTGKPASPPAPPADTAVPPSGGGSPNADGAPSTRSQSHSADQMPVVGTELKRINPELAENRISFDRPLARVSGEAHAEATAALAALVEQTQTAPDANDRLSMPKLLEPAQLKLVETYKRESDRLASLAAKTDVAAATEPKTSHDKKAAFDHDVAAAPVKRPVRREEIAMHIGSLAERNRMDAADAWTVAFYNVFRNYEIATAMRNASGDPALDQAAKAVKLVELGKQAGSELADLVREARIRLCLEAELVPFALGSGYPDKLGMTYDGAAPAGGEMVEGGVRLSIIVVSLDDATIKQLKETGLRVESSDAGTRIVVGVLPLGKLDDLALAECVRRAEMTR